MHRKQKREPSGSLKTVDHVAVEGFGQGTHIINIIVYVSLFVN